MGWPTVDAAPVLLVVPDDDIRETLRYVLSDEGYDVHGVAALPAALARVEEVAFALVLADLYVGTSQYAFTHGHVLRRRVAPSPMGLLIMPPLTGETVAQAGFAFAVPMPFEIEPLLSQAAAALDRPLTSDERRQAVTAERYLSALAAQDWDTLLGLCTEDVTYYPVHGSLATSAYGLHGRDELRGYVEGITQLYRQTHIAHVRVYARPRGLVARYTGLWETPDGRRQQAATTVFFRFRGDRINQVGFRGTLTRMHGERAATALSQTS